jgi:hypothetical protein
VDINYLPAFDFSEAALFVSDMDSTLINIECIDEIADFALQFFLIFVLLTVGLDYVE